MRNTVLAAVLGLALVGAAIAAGKRPEPRLVLEPKQGYSFADLAISGNGKVAAFAMGMGIGIADPRRGKFLRFTKLPGKDAIGAPRIAFAGPDGKLLVSWHERDFVRVWTTSTGALRTKLAPTWNKKDRSAHVGVRIFAASSMRPEVALAHWGGMLQIVNLRRPTRPQEISFGDGKFPHAIAFSPEGERLALVLSSAEHKTQVNVYARGEEKTGWSLEASFVDTPPADADALAKRPVQVWSYVAVADDGKTVFAAGAHVSGSGRSAPPRRCVLRGWDVAEQRWLWNFERNNAHNGLLLAPNGNGLLVGKHGSAVFLDPLTGATVRELEPFPEGHDAFALDSTGAKVWAVTDHVYPGKLIVWDAPPRVVTGTGR